MTDGRLNNVAARSSLERTMRKATLAVALTLVLGSIALVITRGSYHLTGLVSATARS